MLSLGKSGLLTTSHGLRIACLGGLYDQTVFDTVQTPLVRRVLPVYHVLYVARPNTIHKGVSRPLLLSAYG